MKVLIACEESQRVCAAFRERGHDAFSCDIQEPSGGHPEWHILGDVCTILSPDAQSGCIRFLTMDDTLHVFARWDIIIAHPPCTYLSAAGACRLFNRSHEIIDKARERKGWEAVSFFQALLHADCDRICIENPVPLHYWGLPPYQQIVEPFHFGDPWKKRTCLWLKGLPLLRPDRPVVPHGCWVDCAGANSRTKLRDQKGVHTAKDRAKTFPGIARAMAEQWGEGSDDS